MTIPHRRLETYSQPSLQDRKRRFLISQSEQMADVLRSEQSQSDASGCPEPTWRELLQQLKQTGEIDIVVDRLVQCLTRAMLRHHVPLHLAVQEAISRYCESLNNQKRIKDIAMEFPQLPQDLTTQAKRLVKRCQEDLEALGVEIVAVEEGDLFDPTIHKEGNRKVTDEESLHQTIYHCAYPVFRWRDELGQPQAELSDVDIYVWREALEVAFHMASDQPSGNGQAPHSYQDRR